MMPIKKVTLKVTTPMKKNKNSILKVKLKLRLLKDANTN